MQDQRNKFLINLVAGGLGGTLGAVATMPLEVLKTRGQSSLCNLRTIQGMNMGTTGTATISSPIGLYGWVRHILATEGPTAFFKGLLPTVVGVAPTRALYLASYESSKSFYSKLFVRSSTDSSLIHGLSAATSTFLTCTTMSPLWVVKTRMQLHINKKRELLPIKDFCRQIYKSEGLRGYYRGLTASYIGISESMVYFVTYEQLKKKFAEKRRVQGATVGIFRDYTIAAAISKAIASILTYPHEVVRTRLREKGSRGKYNSFTQTLLKVAREEGRMGLYGGLSLQLCRSVPNTAIVFLTYECVVHFFKNNR